MFIHLFEKDIKDIFLIYQELKKRQPVSLEDLCESTGFYEKKIRRAVLYFQTLVNSESIAIQLSIKRKKVSLQIADNSSEKRLLSFLLKYSLPCSILNELIRNSPTNLNQLRKNVYASFSLVRKKLTTLGPLLESYGIKTVSSFPILSGDELQIRCLAFSLSLITDPIINQSPSAYYQRIKMIQQIRMQFDYKIDGDSVHSNPDIPDYVPRFFLKSEQNFLFFWKQLSGLETIHPPEGTTQAIRECLSIVFPTYLEADVMKSSLIEDIYRILLWSAVSRGNMLLVSPAVPPDSKTFRFIIELKYSIPEYGKFLARHPESVILYDEILRKHRVFHQTPDTELSVGC